MSCAISRYKRQSGVHHTISAKSTDPDIRISTLLDTRNHRDGDIIIDTGESQANIHRVD